VSVAALTLYDMLKAIDRAIVIERVLLAEKVGGKSGAYRAPSKREGAQASKTSKRAGARASKPKSERAIRA
jgi:hypothetical protein